MKFDHSDMYLVFACKKEISLLPVREEHPPLLVLNNWAGNHSRILCVEVMAGTIMAGLQNGHLISFGSAAMQNKGGDSHEGLDKPREGYAYNSLLTEKHDGPCGVLWRRKYDQGFISGGYDGSIMIWTVSCNLLNRIDLKQLAQIPVSSFKIKSICEDANINSFIIGTKAGDIIELNTKNECEILLKGHLGELKDLDKLGQNQEAVTVAQDRQLIIWDTAKLEQKSIIQLDYEASCVGGSFDGSHVAVGHPSGLIQIIEAYNTGTLKRIKDFSTPIILLQYSERTEDPVLAAACNLNTIRFYAVDKAYSLISSVSLGSESLLSLDFNLEGDKVRIITKDLGLKYRNVKDGATVTHFIDPGPKMKKNKIAPEIQKLDDPNENSKDLAMSGPANMKETQWSTVGWLLDWPVHALLLDTDIVLRVTAVERSLDRHCIALGLSDGNLRLYRYPCIEKAPAFVEYKVHSSAVTKIKFIPHTNYMISIGSTDRSIVQWKMNIPEVRDDIVRPINENDWKAEYYNELKVVTPMQAVVPIKGNPEDQWKEHIRQWNVPKTFSGSPDQDYNLKYLFGCQVGGSTNYAKLTASQKAAYFLSNTAVIQDPHSKNCKQSYFRLHNTPILCLSLNNEKELVATGDWADSGDHGSVYVWHYKTKDVKCHFKAKGTSGVILVEFSPDSTKLVAVSNDDHHTMDIFDLMINRLVITCKVSESIVVGIAFKNNNEFATVSCDEPRFWKINGANISSAKCDWSLFGFEGKEGLLLKEGSEDQDDDIMDKAAVIKDIPNLLTVCCYAFTQAVFVTATDNGYVYVWINDCYKQKVSSEADERKKDEGKPIRSMISYKSILYTAGDDGIIRTWNYSSQLILERKITLGLQSPLKPGFEIRSLDIGVDEVFLIGTNTANLFVCQEKAHSYKKTHENRAKMSSARETRAFAMVSQSHSSRAICCLAVHPSEPVFVTGSEDARLIIWSASYGSNKYLDMSSLDDPSHVVALDWSSDGMLIAAGTAKGTLCLFDNNLAATMLPKETRGDRILAIKISTYPYKLAVTFQKSTNVYIVDIIQNKKSQTFSINWEERAEVKLKDTCHIMDWSIDGGFIVCTTDSWEQVYIDTKEMRLISYASVKGKIWLTWTQPIGPYVKEIKIETGHEVKYNPVCRSTKFAVKAKDHEMLNGTNPQNLFLAKGDRHGDIHLYRYPSIKANSDHLTLKALAQRLTCVRIFSNDSFIVAASDKDNTIAVFEVDAKNYKKTVENHNEVVEDRNRGQKSSEVSNLERSSRDEGIPCLRPNRSTRLTFEDKIEDSQDMGKEFSLEKALSDIKRFNLPWMAAIRYPTDYLKPPVNSKLVPKLRVIPEYVFGFRAKDCRDNLRYLNKDEVVFATGALVVIHHLNHNRQRFFCEHRGDITCFSLLESHSLAASGDIGTSSNIYIWNTNSLSSVARINTESMHGVVKLRFSKSTAHLLALDSDTSSTISIFNYLTGVKIHSVHGDDAVNPIVDLNWINHNQFISSGMNHLKIWSLDKNILTKAKLSLDPKYESQNFICSLANGRDILAGTDTGDILIWRHGAFNSFPQIYHISKQGVNRDVCGVSNMMVIGTT